MNTATRNLEDDHESILQLIDVMEYIITNDDPDLNHLENIVEIIRNFADGIHHAKEEEIFFPKLSERGFSLDHGPVAVMLNEHRAGRNYVQNISDNLDLYRRGSKESLGDVYSNMKGYAELLRSHIAKENNVLFRMANSLLSAEDQQELLSQFEKAEKERTPASYYINLIREMSVFYEI